MDIFLRVTAGILIAVVLNVVIAKQGKDISLLLVLAVCTMVATVAVEFFREIITFLRKLESVGNLNGGMLKILLKCVGIALLSEISGMICTDFGNASLSKILHMLATAVILWLALPVFTELIELAEQILGAA